MPPIPDPAEPGPGPARAAPIPPRAPKPGAREVRAKGGGGEAEGELLEGDEDETRVRLPSGDDRTRTWFGVRAEVSRTISRIMGGIEEVVVGAGEGEEEAGEGIGEMSEETERHVRSSELNSPVSGSSRLNCNRQVNQQLVVSKSTITQACAPGRTPPVHATPLRPCDGGGGAYPFVALARPTLLTWSS